ncbi:DNA polymerase III subunit theta [Pantoea anthophila]|uniref:DNA polymerase III subunit theta n=1 Tax=Pantoea anthophila TaxID=470931 RepID=UPI002DBE5BE6|nr:DNA polymerase III subunit theta [Pantoea anthophila]MEB5704682.1 DNA polymerase III subunit theta [Pantoea anthophila]MEB6515555.1 DNA polymerase III subunit theta [Pantoea anthophila]
MGTGKVVLELPIGLQIRQGVYDMPVIPHEVEMQQPESQREYFRERLQHDRNVSLQYPRGTDAINQKEEGK